MLVALRRGPASIAKCLRLPPTSSYSSSPSSALFGVSPCYWKNPSINTRLSSVSALRALHTSSPWRQEAAEQAVVEEVAAEAHENNGLGEAEGMHGERGARGKYQKDRVQDLSRKGDAADHESTQKSSQTKAEGGLITTFSELKEQNMVCKTIIDTIVRQMKLTTMTTVQSLTINETLKGTDVLAQARTGTGKTLAFLIPVLQNIITKDPTLEFSHPFQRGSRATAQDIRAIIISPTRELAEQIAVEARKVTKGTGIIVQTAVGGTMKRLGLHKITKEGCHILVGTPGRLADILSDPYSGVKVPSLTALVLDEADRLLDQGFAAEIQKIQTFFPQHDRQTLLFSATVPPEVMSMVRRTMKPDFKFVKTVQAGELETREKVTQNLVMIRSFDNIMPTLVELCRREQSGPNGSSFKAIVYFAATAEVALAASTFANLKNPLAPNVFAKNLFYPASIIEMHGRLTQDQRTRAAGAFRLAKTGIMLSSDVTARGMDFPNVTHVIQVGLPSNRESYVHRIGRTARGEKQGEGWLLLTDLEKTEARSRLRGMPLTVDTSLEIARVDMSADAQLTPPAAEILTQTIESSKLVHPILKDAAYLACLGIYSWAPVKQKVVDSLNRRAKYVWSMDTPPAVSHGLAAKLRYLGIQGVNIGRPASYESYGQPNEKPRRFERNSPEPGRGGQDGQSWRRTGGFSRGSTPYQGRTASGYGRAPDRSFDSEGSSDRLRRSFVNGASSSDRPRRNFDNQGSSDRPRRSFDNQGSYDRPRRSYEGQDRGGYRGGQSRDGSGSGGGYRGRQGSDREGGRKENDDEW